MKIVDVVCSKARTGFFFDDQRAIKKALFLTALHILGRPLHRDLSL